MKKNEKYSTYEIVHSGLIGFGAAVTLHRLEAAIRPSKRFMISEIGIVAFSAFVFVQVADKALEVLHREKKDEKVDLKIKDFGEWLRERTMEEEKAAEEVVKEEDVEDGDE